MLPTTGKMKVDYLRSTNGSKDIRAIDYDCKITSTVRAWAVISVFNYGCIPQRPCDKA